MRQLVGILLTGLILTGVNLLSGPPAASATDIGRVLYSPNISANPNEDASYPRVIRLSHSGNANGTILATFSHSGVSGRKADFPIYRSTDDGHTWSASPIGTVTDTVHGWDLDGPTLFELPQAEGPLPAGTLLAAGTAWIHGDYTQQAIEVFTSTDQGATWSYRSSCTSESGLANSQGHGIWEPEFAIAGDGSLVCYFSDERPSTNGYNQVLAHVRSTDGGATWNSEVYDVAVQDNVQRPGMATVVKLPNGSYAMSYEDCKNGYDPDQACSVYLKTSVDGLSWTPVSGLGSLVQTADNRHLLHTPYLAWSPIGGSNGTLLMSGQRVIAGPDGNVTVQPESGTVLFANTNLGSGNWTETTSPVTVNPTGGYDAGETACPGYSSPILPSVSGDTILYLSGTAISNGKCEVRFGTDLTPGPTGQITGPGTTGKCVDVDKNTGASGNGVQLWDCGIATGQRWSVEPDGTLRAFGKCLDIVGNGTANYTKVQLWDCASGVGGQQWRVQADGSLLNPQSGRCLDDPQADTANGARLQIYDCNGLWTQQWALPGAPTAPITGPGTTGKCVDVDTNTPTNGNAVQLWTCGGVPGQQWSAEPDGTLRAFGKCLDIVGNGTANYTKVQLWDCASGVGGQQWRVQANGSLLNPQSGRCLDDPQADTANGTRLQIYDCNGLWTQQWNVAV
ncbi:ricin-type beta-trefoil lectin domain protein [Actinoallomurus rhizosphaericola]|uniref:ricin-type beta-trefoil lectin domain protein n=1 Tax=Actinoallomurus rhizosphaericola TaxID=2952536 RepID=UPI002090B540|nr:ricin-type beta-trefoil lectin domain protein [Actinoallomurus rhizosphaericola]MCO5993356.1 ricin-type beta-trefoil lectin domain protein [Actinoallomurus rhizosphaericola]